MLKNFDLIEKINKFEQLPIDGHGQNYQGIQDLV